MRGKGRQQPYWLSLGQCSNSNTGSFTIFFVATLFFAREISSAAAPKQSIDHDFRLVAFVRLHEIVSGQPGQGFATGCEGRIQTLISHF
jgi:hypothetical protein